MQGRLYAQQRRVLLGSLRPGERLASGPRGRGCALVPQPHPLPTWRGAPRPLGGGGGTRTDPVGVTPSPPRWTSKGARAPQALRAVCTALVLPT